MVVQAVAATRCAAVRCSASTSTTCPSCGAQLSAKNTKRHLAFCSPDLLDPVGWKSGDQRYILQAARKSRHRKALELRAARDLAGLWVDQGERQRALDLLVPVYDWFTEGFDTRDLIEVKALLDELA